MRLVPLRQWIDRTFEEPKPSLPTIRKQIRFGDWPAPAARKVGGRYFIDLDKVESQEDGSWLLNVTA